MRRWLLLGALASPAAQAADCPDAELSFPPQGARVAEARPVLAWRPLPGVYQYRVQIESRIANGRVIARVDQEVAGTQFAPAQPLADEQSAVKVRVSAACGVASQPTIGELGARFFIDLRETCPSPEAVALSGEARLRLEWRGEPRVRHTEVFVYSALDGALVASQRTPDAAIEAPRPTGPLVVALRHRCPEAASAMVYRVVTARER